MKKIIILFILLFNLFPSFKDGKFGMTINTVAAQPMNEEGDCHGCGESFQVTINNCTQTFEHTCFDYNGWQHSLLQDCNSGQGGSGTDSTGTGGDEDIIHTITVIEPIDLCNYYVVTYLVHSNGDPDELQDSYLVTMDGCEIDNPYFEYRYEYIDACSYYEILVLVHTNGEPDEEISADVITDFSCVDGGYGGCADYFTSYPYSNVPGESCEDIYINNDCSGSSELVSSNCVNTSEDDNTPPNTPSYKLYLSTPPNTALRELKQGEQIISVVGESAFKHFYFTYNNASGLTEALIKWKVNNVDVMTGDHIYDLDISTAGIKIIGVYNANTGAKLFEVSMKVIDKSFVLFKQKSDWQGEFGFDDDGYKFSAIQNQYNHFSVSGETFYAPWVSLFMNETRSITIEPHITNVNAQAGSGFSVKFIPSIPSDIVITINGVPSTSQGWIQLTGADLKGITEISIKVKTEFGQSYSQAANRPNVKVITNTGEVIGQFDLNCLNKANIIPKNIVYVAVKKDLTGYPSLTGVHNYVTNNSTNQIFKTWNVCTGYANTLDISSQFYSNYNSYTQVPTVNNTFRTAYKNKTGVDIRAINSYPTNELLEPTNPNRVYFVFYTNYSLTGLGGNWDGWTHWDGLWCTSKNIRGVVVHEIGHMLNLNHTFLSPYLGSEGITTNNLRTIILTEVNSTFTNG